MKISAWTRQHPAEIVTVRAETPLAQAVAVLLSKPGLRDIYVVTDDGKVIGHLSHKKLANLMLAQHRPVHTRRQIIERVTGGVAKDLMTAHFVSAHPEEELDNVLHRQLEHGVEDMPVVDTDGGLVGAVNLTEVLREVHSRSLPNQDSSS